MKLREWLTYINQIHFKAIDLGLERILPVAQALNLTHFPCPVITVGGTNGKGSVIKTLEQIYLAQGLKVAAYTSPHLLHFNERLAINGEFCADLLWEEAFAIIEQARKKMALSFFEFTTLAALWICQQTTLDLLILEIGLGGRLDAVNIVEPTLSIITNVDIDHVQWLGETREKIGYEKAGIFRSQSKAICGDPNPPRSLLAVAAEKNLELFCFEKDYFILKNKTSWHWQSTHSHFYDLPLPQVRLQNAATALMAVELLGLSYSRFAIEKGLENAILPGRYEMTNQGCRIIMDVAHNPQSCLYLLERFCQEEVEGRRYAVVGMLEDKDLKANLSPFVDYIDSWYLASLDESRGAKALELHGVLTENGAQNCYQFDDVGQAFKMALENTNPQDIILVFGSFHTVAKVKEVIHAIRN